MGNCANTASIVPITNSITESCVTTINPSRNSELWTFDNQTREIRMIVDVTPIQAILLLQYEEIRELHKAIHQIQTGKRVNDTSLLKAVKDILTTVTNIPDAKIEALQLSHSNAELLRNSLLSTSEKTLDIVNIVLIWQAAIKAYMHLITNI